MSEHAKVIIGATDANLDMHLVLIGLPVICEPLFFKAAILWNLHLHPFSCFVLARRPEIDTITTLCPDISM